MSERLGLPADPRPPDARWRQRKAHLVEELRRAARRRRRRRLAAIVLVPVAALGLVAAALVVSRSPRITAHLGCYAAPSVEADTTVVDADGRPPTAICAELWARGEVDPAARTAPPLEACVLRTGPVGVFPADPPGVCERLGLARLRMDGYQTTTGRIGALRDALVARVNPDRRCLNEAAARAEVRRQLDRLGLSDWTVRVEPGSFAGRRPCAAFGLLEREHQVFLDGGLSGLPDALQAGLDSTYGRCLAAGPAAALARRELDRRGFGDWTVQLAQGSWSADRPCTTAEINHSLQVVVLSGEEDLSRYLRRDG
jgi:hypothetical protein